MEREAVGLHGKWFRWCVYGVCLTFTALLFGYVYKFFLIHVGQIHPEVKFHSIGIISEDFGEVITSLSVDESQNGHILFTLKEGSHYQLKLKFSVLHNIVSGLAYCNNVWKGGLQGKLSILLSHDFKLWFATTIWLKYCDFWDIRNFIWGCICSQYCWSQCNCNLNFSVA